jgi:hypothetical protein
VKKVRAIDALPEWLDVTRYTSANTLDAHGWYWQFEARIVIHNYLTWFAEDEFYERYGNHAGLPWSRLASALWHHIKQTPILDLSDKNVKTKFVDSGLLRPPRSGISLPSLEDMLQHIRASTLGVSRIVDHLAGVRRVDTRTAEMPLQMAGQNDLDTVLLSVDLCLPEQVLLKNFAALIKEAKDRRNDAQALRYREPVFSEWVSATTGTERDKRRRPPDIPTKLGR